MEELWAWANENMLQDPSLSTSQTPIDAAVSLQRFSPTRRIGRSGSGAEKPSIGAAKRGLATITQHQLPRISQFWNPGLVSVANGFVSVTSDSILSNPPCVVARDLEDRQSQQSIEAFNA